ncbi:unnamed protein product [Sphagnum jensenii]|uniref:Protein kinase domain-containing protein n=1 Tax=Sphagnum jensenii TaxID=128206 RepID=A0ABP1AVT2_9BRYO
MMIKMGVAAARGAGAGTGLDRGGVVVAVALVYSMLVAVVASAAAAVSSKSGAALIVHDVHVQVQRSQQLPIAAAAVITNCSDPSEQQTSECTSPGIDCWTLYIRNSSMLRLCESFTSLNSTLVSPSPDCCSAVQSAWQLWPRRCFCNYIYFQYVPEHRHALPLLCDVTNSICHTCISLHPPDPAVATCGGDLVPGKSSKRTLIIVAVTITALVVCIIIAVLTYWFAFRHKKKPYSRFPDASHDLNGILKLGGGPTLFSYNVLKSATKNFHIGNKLGEGGFGAVFKGLLPDGMEVAVKQLSMDSKQGNEEFLNEVMFVTGVQHRNLVKLRGCCLKGNERILVYEYLPNKSLYQALFDNENGQQLDWPKRFKIAVGTAQGLAYLHEGCQTRIVHRDIKASNILLDEDYIPKIADFGLARFFLDNQTHVSTRVAGTKGYLAPEYLLRGQLTEKADVFSFGVVMMELVSGRSNFDPRLPLDVAYLLDWTWQLHEKKKLKDIMDPSLLEGTGYCEEEALRLVTIALLCTQSEPTMRPTMTRVVAMLAGDANSDIPEIVESSKPQALLLTELPTWNDKPTKCNSSQLSDDQASGPSMRNGSISFSMIQPR